LGALALRVCGAPTDAGPVEANHALPAVGGAAADPLAHPVSAHFTLQTVGLGVEALGGAGTTDAEAAGTAGGVV
jgi:hypothetical protein